MDDPKLITDAGGTRVVISHDDPNYGPWRVCPVKPTGLRAAMRVLAGRYEPQLTLQRSLTMRGMDRAMRMV